jgi:nitroreductase
MDLATVDKLLTTTRSVRKRLDLTRPVDPEVLQHCLEIATQAPVGGNNCRYHFVVVADPTKRAALADLYRRAMRQRFSDRRVPFRAVANSKNGSLNGETIMRFISDDLVIVGSYSGGTIVAGHVLAKRLDESEIEMLYQGATTAGQVQAGKARAQF